jgi:hypothetical protein
MRLFTKSSEMLTLCMPRYLCLECIYQNLAHACPDNRWEGVIGVQLSEEAFSRSICLVVIGIQPADVRL